MAVNEAGHNRVALGVHPLVRPAGATCAQATPRHLAAVDHECCVVECPDPPEPERLVVGDKSADVVD